MYNFYRISNGLENKAVFASFFEFYVSRTEELLFYQVYMYCWENPHHIFIVWHFSQRFRHIDCIEKYVVKISAFLLNF